PVAVEGAVSDAYASASPERQTVKHAAMVGFIANKGAVLDSNAPIHNKRPTIEGDGVIGNHGTHDANTTGISIHCTPAIGGVPCNDAVHNGDAANFLQFTIANSYRTATAIAVTVADGAVLKNDRRRIHVDGPAV